MADAPILTRAGARVTIAGPLRTPFDQEQLKELAAEATGELHADRPELVIDVAGATYLDSRTLVALTSIARRCADAGVTLVLEGFTDEQRELLRLTHIDEVLTLRGARVEPARPAA